eukprot:789580-Prymnesium_polylepis.1
MAKTFADTPGLSEISLTVKTEIEAFVPMMPLVTALRNPGMRPRHWDELTKQVCAPARPSLGASPPPPSYTLT